MDPAEHAAERDEAADRRDLAAADRDLAAADRDLEADERDEFAEQREEWARQRDQAIRDRLWAEHLGSEARDLRAWLAHTRSNRAVDHEQALIDREVAISAVALAEDELREALTDARRDRWHAAVDRHASRRDRENAGLDRAASSHDRDATAADRDQSAVDAQLIRDPMPTSSDPAES